jgi:hypothetical protein
MVVGNVLADEAARPRPRSKLQDGDENERHDTVSYEGVADNPFESRYWLRAKVRDAAIENTEDDNRNNARTKELPNMHDALKLHMHLVHKIGFSNQESIYFQAWKKITPQIDVKNSSHFMTSTKVTYKQRKQTLRYRTGTLNTNVMRHRMDPTVPSNCPLCGGADGGHHAVSGCPVIAQGVGANRHHAAGRRIVRAIYKGAKGAALVMADVGRKELLEQDGLGHLPHTIPDWILPPSIRDQEERMRLKQKFKPDALMVLGPSNNAMCKDSIVYVIELKYCQDTDPTQQECRAQCQHADLMSHLIEWWGCKVQLIPLMLGVGGTIYSEMQAKFVLLGVEGAAYNNLAQTLNALAAEYVEKAMLCRFANIQSNMQPSNVAGNRLSLRHDYMHQKFKRKRH